jgi:hypothetical protein
MKFSSAFGMTLSLIGLSACAGQSMPHIKTDSVVTIDGAGCGNGWNYNTIRTISDPESISEITRFFNDRNDGFRHSFIDAPSGRYVVVFNRNLPSSSIVAVSPTEIIREQRIRSINSEDYDAFLKISRLGDVPIC